jgi:phosphomannomutase / phosphoglucomutase
MGRLFGTNGVRGVFNKDLTLDLALRLSYALGTYFKEGKVLLGYDGRYSSPLLADVVTAGLNAMGLDVYNAGLVPTPCLQYCVKRLGYDGGVMITASHNPPEYNGIKVMARDGVEIPREEEGIIEEIFFSSNFKLSDRLGREYSISNAIDVYINGILSLVNYDAIRSKGFKVVVDLGNGAQAVAVPRLLDALGCKVITINERIDGSFPGRGSEPTVDNLHDLKAKVIDSNADLGVAYDGDGDRSIFCDEHGNIYTGDRSGAILIDHILKQYKGYSNDVKIVTPINSSMLIDIVASKYRAKVIRIKVGSVEVSREMLRSNALLGLEENGGFMYARHIAVRDGAMSTALMLEALAVSNNSLSELNSMHRRFYQYKTKFQCSSTESLRVIEELRNDAKDKRIESIDGIKIWIDDESWVMVRQSGTEPIMRLYAEASDDVRLKDIVRLYTEKIRSILKR